jgi:hypothetical protein
MGIPGLRRRRRDPGTSRKAPENVSAKLRGIQQRILLVKAEALGLISLISLSQLGIGTKFGSGGPRFLLPVSVSTVIAAAVAFGWAYWNMAFASAQLDGRLTTTVKTEDGKEKPLLTKEEEVPDDIKKTSGRGWNQALLGLFLALVAVAFYLASVWWPAAVSVSGRSPSSTRTPPSSTATTSSSTATPTTTPTPTVSVTVTPTVIVTVTITLPPTIPSLPTEPGLG